MKARIIDNRYGGNYTEDFISKNLELVSDWIFTGILPTEEQSKHCKWLFWDGVKWVLEKEIEEIEREYMPKCVSQRQLRTQLVLNGFDLNSVQLAINELTEPDKSVAQIAWDYAITFERDSPLLVCLASNLGLTQNEVDEIFLNASKL